MRRLFKLIFSKFAPIRCARWKGVQVGTGCRFISYPDFDTEPYLIEIGSGVEISKDVRFITHDGATWVFRKQDKYKNVVRFGRIVVGDNSFIGTRSTILPNVKIGKNCIIGACSLVTKSIPDGQIWGGVPAKYIGETFEFAEKCLKESPRADMSLLEKAQTKKGSNADNEAA